MSGKIIDNKRSMPQWVESQHFEKVLKENFPNYKNIKDFTVKPGMAPGENNATIMLRVEIEVELRDSSSKSISFILKVQNDNETAQEIMKGHDILDIENSMYDKIIPELEKLYADVGVDVKFSAKSHKLPIKNSYLLLENLGKRGFKNVNRLEGLDVEHTKFALKKLAQWHAASAVFVTVKGPFEKKYAQGCFRDDSKDAMKTKFDGMIQIFQSFAKTYNNYKDYADDIHFANATMIEEFFKAAKPDPNEFNVLNHGDLCSNNIMFQYDAFGKIKEAYFVDYEMPKYGTPAQDLFHLLLSSTKYEIKIQEFDYFLKFYHDHLLDNLKLLRYSKKIPTLGNLHAMMYKYGIWGYLTVTGVMAAVLFDPTKIANFGDFNGDVSSSLSFKTSMYSNELYRKHAELVLPWLKNRGAMEF